MSGTRPDDRRPGTEIFSNGNREGSNDFLYYGIDNNDRLTLSIVLRPGVEAIREFKVQTNLFSADQGRNSGAVVDVVTKSGTNSWHGSAFEFLRNSAMDARSFFNVVGQPFPSFRYNQFGGSLGGPVMLPKVYNGKDKTFFFVDYEGFRRNQQQVATVTIPTVAARSGNFSAFPNKIYDPATTTVSGSSYTRVPSWRPSFAAPTQTCCGTIQLVGVKTRLATETVPSAVLEEPTGIVTLASGKSLRRAALVSLKVATSPENDVP